MSGGAVLGNFWLAFPHLEGAVWGVIWFFFPYLGGNLGGDLPGLPHIWGAKLGVIWLFFPWQFGASFVVLGGKSGPQFWKFGARIGPEFRRGHPKNNKITTKLVWPQSPIKQGISQILL